MDKCFKYKAAILGPMIVIEQGRKTAALEQPWSTIVRMASFPFTFGRPMIRSMVTCWKGRVSSNVVMW